MKSSFKLRRPADRSIPIVGLILSILGLVMILSASQFFAAENFGSSYYFFVRQLVAWVVGIGFFFYFLNIRLEVLYENRVTFLYLTLITLVLVFVPIIGPKIAGVHRWLNFGLFRAQPAEVAKLLLIVYFSALLAAKGEQLKTFTRGFLPFAVILALVVLLVVAEPDIGTAIVIVTLALAIFFVAGAKLLHLGTIIVLGLVALLLLTYAAPYRNERLQVFLNRNNSSQDSLGSAYHSQQALIAIGSGGLWGVGFGQGTSKYSYLPQSHTDSIFAVIAEELGFVRASLVLLALFYLVWRGFLIASHANSRFVQLLAVGITVSLITQAMLNIGGMLNLVPLTGVPLPFISYGGSSLVVTLASLGLLTNISREVE